MNTLKNWIDCDRVEQIFNSYRNGYNRTELLSATMGKSNLIYIGKTSTGTIVGGYTDTLGIPTSEGNFGQSSSNIFVFNLKTNNKWNPSKRNYYPNFYASTVAQGGNIVGFGTYDALKFEHRWDSTGNSVVVTYA